MMYDDNNIAVILQLRLLSSWNTIYAMIMQLFGIGLRIRVVIAVDC